MTQKDKNVPELEFLKEIHHLADCVTAKKAYQDYLDDLRDKIDERIEVVTTEEEYKDRVFPVSANDIRKEREGTKEL